MDIHKATRRRANAPGHGTKAVTFMQVDPIAQHTASEIAEQSQGDSPRYSWMQPICDDCCDEREPDRLPIALRDAPTERCVDCGRLTSIGVYIRVDPKAAKYPTTLVKDRRI